MTWQEGTCSVRDCPNVNAWWGVSGRCPIHQTPEDRKALADFQSTVFNAHTPGNPATR